MTAAPLPPSSPSLLRVRRAALAELARFRPFLATALRARFDESMTGAVLSEQETHFLRLLAQAADPGWQAPHMRSFTIGGAVYIAIYLALAPRGLSPAEIWTICEGATRARFAAMSGIERWLASQGMFSGLMRSLSRFLSRRSGKRALGGWVFSFVEGVAGDFDYGVNYTRCAIFELALAVGARDFAPYICLADIPGSEAFGWGLQRRETLAQGGSRCDFRFRRGHDTDVKVHLPVL